MREAAGLTQVQVSKRSGLAQPEVSKLEAASSLDDRQISTLRRYLAALGDDLDLVSVSKHGHRIGVAAVQGVHETEAPAITEDEARDRVWQKMIGIHDSLNVIRLQCPTLDGIDDAQTILHMLATSFVSNSPAPTPTPALLRAREVRGGVAQHVARRLATKGWKLSGDGARVVHPFGGVLPRRRAKNMHAELVAEQLSSWQAGAPVTPADDAAFGQLAKASAEAIVVLLRYMWTSPLSKHLETRWTDDAAREKDATMIARTFETELRKANADRLGGERAVILALRAVGWPRPENLFSRQDK
jgi:transcriptional regulator with XRE-family HTH domain